MLVLAGGVFCGMLSRADIDVDQGNGTVVRHQAQSEGSGIRVQLNENWTMAVTIPWSADSPRHTMIGLSNGGDSLCRSLANKGDALGLVFTPALLRGLNRVSGNYTLTVAIHSHVWEMGVVEFVAAPTLPEFPDVEWDFAPPPRVPGDTVVTVFCVLVFVPVPLLVWGLVGAVNCRLFPRSLWGAVKSVAFVVALGFALGYFVYFWMAVQIEDMLVRCAIAVPVLGLLLRGALGARKAELRRRVKVE